MSCTEKSRPDLWKKEGEENENNLEANNGAENAEPTEQDSNEIVNQLPK